MKKQATLFPYLLEIKDGIPTYSKPSDFKQDQTIFIQPISMDNTFLSNPHLHRHSFYEWVYITDGTGTHQIDFETYHIAPNQLYFIRPGQLHMLNATTPLHGFYITFTSDFIMPPQHDQFILNLGTTPYINIQDDSQDDLNRTLNNMKIELDLNRPYKEEFLNHYLTFFCLKLKRYMNADHITLYPTIVKQFFSILESTISATQTVKSIANTLCISANHLTQTIKHATKKDASYWIRHTILLESKRLLAFTTLSVTEISYRLHFSEPSYFYKFFKRYHLLTPTEFRKKFQKER